MGGFFFSFPIYLDFCSLLLGIFTLFYSYYP
ncbi:hypothetical protein T02_11530 [Trichinella nativa]|uniref:Uncharacterized protein n=1 Tax=Trichinella nativa TaxID=6335 RepID=A0A0V1KIF0_9BILA|nr:hypothetical protein T02_11530 [Trichinella nativa]